MNSTNLPATDRGRRLSYVAFAAVVIVYLVIIQLGGKLIGGWADEDDIFTTRGLVFTMFIPLGLALIFTYGVVAWLGWWKPVMTDDRPVRRWLWAVPIIFAIAILIGIDYSSLSEKGWGYILLLLIVTQFVGWGEEGMFRGISVTMMRDHGLREGQVALWSSLVFGLVHLSNVVSHGSSAVAQAVVVGLAGYFFYLTRRVSGSNALNSVMHGLFDFALISGSMIAAGQQFYIGAMAPILIYVILAVILLIGRRKIELPQPVGAQPVMN
ncbi:CPBP family intramembrane glutamic endopeptidase [Gordonia neofelifaecis]|uniref:Integral membrane protein n=1 Tax=Gordonia neofelifaecis NRRL B-59395 TaxID=644548 RepID=F1YMA2_9ACTN|nr:CPBP family intramembrane glutamic endopeptidase [Gordonia neofelifaecis]EGD54151.1 integral membrane protein [Gordonia neofelifaecis NRRL B-59395]